MARKWGLGGMDDGKWWGFFPYRKKIYIQLITCGEGVFLCGRFQKKNMYIHLWLEQRSQTTVVQPFFSRMVALNSKKTSSTEAPNVEHSLIHDRNEGWAAWKDYIVLGNKKTNQKLMKTHGFFSEIDGSYSIFRSFRGSMDRRFWIFLDNIQGCSSIFFFRGHVQLTWQTSGCSSY